MKLRLALALALHLVALRAHAAPGTGGLLGVQPDRELPPVAAWSLSDPTPTGNGEVDLIRSWTPDAANGVQLTVVSRKDSPYVITRVEYAWQPGTQGELGFEANAAAGRQSAVATDRASDFAHRIQLPGVRGKAFEAVEASRDHTAENWHVGARVTLSAVSARFLGPREKVVELFGRAPKAIER